MVSVTKKPCHTLSVANSRGVLLAAHSGKVLGRLLRAELMPHLRLAALETQLGGVPRKSIDLASHLTRLRMARAARRGWSAATLFVDQTAAFYRASVEGAAAELLRAGADPAAVQMLSEWHRGSWFEVDGSGLVALPGGGARPGDPLADVTFSADFVGLLRAVRAELVARGYLTTSTLREGGIFSPGAELEEPAEQTGPTWVDDETIFLEHPDPVELLRRLKDAADIFITIAAQRGHQVNLSHGKTEAVVRLAGPGKVAALSILTPQVASDADTRDVLLLDIGHGRSLRIVREYKHLGTMLTICGGLRREAARRACSSRAVVVAFRRRLLADRSLGRGVRARMLHSFVDAAQFSAAGCWEELPKRDERRLEAVRMSAVRSMLGERAGPGCRPDRALREDLGVLSVGAALRGRRLRYLPRLSLEAPSALLALLQAEPLDRGWKAAAHAADAFQPARRPS